MMTDRCGFEYRGRVCYICGNTCAYKGTGSYIVVSKHYEDMPASIPYYLCTTCGEDLVKYVGIERKTYRMKQEVQE